MLTSNAFLADKVSTAYGARGTGKKQIGASLSPSTHGSPSREGRRVNLERRIAFLEVELKTSEEKCLALEQTVKDLRREMTNDKVGGEGTYEERATGEVCMGG